MLLDGSRCSPTATATTPAARQLHVSVNTVRNYIRSVHDKLHVHSKSEAVSSRSSAGSCETVAARVSRDLGRFSFVKNVHAVPAGEAARRQAWPWLDLR
jgi:hypothetical protein